MTIATIVGPALTSSPSHNEDDSRNGSPTRGAPSKPFLRYLRIAIGAAGLFASLAHPLTAFAAKPTLTEVKVFPADVNLKTRGDRQSIVVQAIYADGVTRDVTAQASFTLGNKTLAKFDLPQYRKMDGYEQLIQLNLKRAYGDLSNNFLP